MVVGLSIDVRARALCRSLSGGIVSGGGGVTADMGWPTGIAAKFWDTRCRW